MTRAQSCVLPKYFIGPLKYCFWSKQIFHEFFFAHRWRFPMEIVILSNGKSWIFIKYGRKKMFPPSQNVQFKGFFKKFKRFELLRLTSYSSQPRVIFLKSFTTFGGSPARQGYFLRGACLKIFLFAYNFLVPDLQHFEIESFQIKKRSGWPSSWCGMVRSWLPPSH